MQFDPVGTAKFVSACDIAKSSLVTKGISFTTRPSSDGRTYVIVGTERVPIAGGETLAGAELKALKTKTAETIGAELKAAGYPTTADPKQSNMTLLIIVLLLFVVAATALYGPQASALVEMFPTRVRYTAMSFPYHVGTGWVGGFLPVTSFAIVAITGNIYSGPLVLGHLHGNLGCRLISLPEGNRRAPPPRRIVPTNGYGHQWMSIGCSASASTRPIGSFELWPSAIACSSRSRLSWPVMVIRIVLADRIAARVRLTRATGASEGIGSGITPTARRALGASSASCRSGPAKIDAV